MPSTGLRYTLVGFDADLDWRPLCFVNPIPPNRICRACGVVCRVTVLLPCMHLLCQCCYEQCVHEGVRVCPLDEQRCSDEDVVWTEFPTEEILRRQVKCWNEATGCADVMAASEVCRHFQQECMHHSVSCPKCLATVVHSDVCMHLRSNCRISMIACTSEHEGLSRFNDRREFFSAFSLAPEQQTYEIRTFLERMFVERESHDDRLNELCHSMNTLKEALRHEMATLSESFREVPDLIRESQNSFTRSMSEMTASNEHIKICLNARKLQTENLARDVNTIKATLKDELVNPMRNKTERLAHIADAIGTTTAAAEQRSEKTLHWTKELFRMAALQMDQCAFFIKGVGAHRCKSLQEGFSDYAHEKVYLRGYCISPGVRFRNARDSTTLHALLQLHKGDMDDSVTWPFAFKVKFSVLNALSDAKKEIIVMPDPFRNIDRPPNTSSELFWLNDHSLRLSDPNWDGYLYNDRLVVESQLLL